MSSPRSAGGKDGKIAVKSVSPESAPVTKPNVILRGLQVAQRVEKRNAPVGFDNSIIAKRNSTLRAWVQ